ncbi:hypothetical protein RKD23_007808 [Streptomyces sp. SAI-170]
MNLVLAPAPAEHLCSRGAHHDIGATSTASAGTPPLAGAHARGAK